MKEADSKFDLKGIMPVELRLLDGQVDIILRSLELYAYNLEFMLNTENSDENERQKKLALLKYTYEQVLSIQAEQVNAKTDFNNVSNIGRKIIQDTKVMDVIPDIRDFKVV